MTNYDKFLKELKSFIENNPELAQRVLSNIFSMRIIGNKTHGDLAEIGISELVTQFIPNYTGKHVGKDLYRAKEHEEDIEITNNTTNKKFTVSLKAYGDGPLQLSTDSDCKMFSYLKENIKSGTDSKEDIQKVFESDAFAGLMQTNILPLIYNEKESMCNIMPFDIEKVIKNTAKIVFIDSGKKYDEKTKKVISAKGRKHPVYLFLDKDGKYICEVRYGAANANALQRGLWTHTKKALPYFNSLTEGWVKYSINKSLVNLIALALLCQQDCHSETIKILKENIGSQKYE